MLNLSLIFRVPSLFWTFLVVSPKSAYPLHCKLENATLKILWLTRSFCCDCEGLLFHERAHFYCWPLHQPIGLILWSLWAENKKGKEIQRVTKKLGVIPKGDYRAKPQLNFQVLYEHFFNLWNINEHIFDVFPCSSLLEIMWLGRRCCSFSLWMDKMIFFFLCKKYYFMRTSPPPLSQKCCILSL